MWSWSRIRRRRLLLDLYAMGLDYDYDYGIIYATLCCAMLWVLDMMLRVRRISGGGLMGCSCCCFDKSVFR